MSIWLFGWFNLIAYYWLAFFFQGIAVAVGLFLLWKFGMLGGGFDPTLGSDFEPDTLDEQKKKLKKWAK